MKRTVLFIFVSSIAFSLPSADSAPERPSARKASDAGAGEWAQFRGPRGGAVSEDTGLPTTWSATENIVWKAKLPGPGGSSPIVLGDKVFITCYSGYGIPGEDAGDQKDLRRHVVCIDRKSGGILWNKEIEAKLPETNYRGFIALHGYASSTPATDGERLYVFFGKSGVLAFDLEGKKLWQVSVGTKTHGWGSATSPVLSKDHVIVNASVECGALVALDKKTGAEAWKAPGIQRCWGTPVLVNVEGKQELAVSVPGKVLGFDPVTGKSLWKCDGISDYICPSAVAENGVVYAIGGRATKALAVKAGGRGDVTESHRLWIKEVGANVCSPLVYRDHFYWVSDSGTAYCLKAKTGEKAYGQRLAGSGRIYASAVAADGKLFVVSREKGTYVLAAHPTFKQLAHNTIGSDHGIFNGTPAVSDGRLLLRSDQYLYCIGKK
jgi:outer membrane protein assembly factor BamB